MILFQHKELAIWGSGKLGKRCFLKIKRYYDIICFFDNALEKIGKIVIENVKVQKYIGQKYYIIIATDFWKEIVLQLQKEGLRLVDDFLPANLLLNEKIYLNDLLDVFDEEDVLNYLTFVNKSKKIAMIYGNCQIDILCNMLELNSGFEADFLILRIPPVHLYTGVTQVKKIFYNKIIKKVDLFIYQNVSYENGYFSELSSESICNQLSLNCNKIRIHNIYFDGYFIQNDNSVKKQFIKNMEKYMFPYADKYIDKLIYKGYDLKMIISVISDASFVSSDVIYEKCERSIRELERREKDVDIGVVDYIEDNYQKYQLFYTNNHPTNEVVKVYVNRLLELLGYKGNPQMDEKTMFMQFGYAMKNSDWPIYPCVIDTLGLKEYEKFFYTYTVVDDQLYSFDEFMREYINRCYF